MLSMINDFLVKSCSNSIKLLLTPLESRLVELVLRHFTSLLKIIDYNKNNVKIPFYSLLLTKYKKYIKVPILLADLLVRPSYSHICLQYIRPTVHVVLVIGHWASGIWSPANLRLAKPCNVQCASW